MMDNNKLLKEIKLGNKKALNQFIKQNLNLVIYIAYDYTNRGVEFEDLVQEGLIGLYKSIIKFDPSINPKFSVYASYWIKKCMIETIQKNSRMIYVPNHINTKINNLKHKISDLSIKLNRYPTLDEIIEETGLSKKEIALLYNHSFHITSINQKIDCVLSEEGLSDDELLLEELIVNDNPTTEEEVENKDKRKKILELLETSNLSNRAIKILKLRYGFYDGVIYTYKEIGKIMGGITPQAIHSCETNSIKKLKRNKRFLELAIYLDKTEKEIEQIKQNIGTKKEKKILLK